MRLCAVLLACLLASCAPVTYRHWLVLQYRWAPESMRFEGARVVGRYATERECERALWPPSYITTGSKTVRAEFQCVRSVPAHGFKVEVNHTER